MTDRSRRRVLQTAGGLAIAALAGCTGDAAENGVDEETTNESDASNETDGSDETAATNEEVDETGEEDAAEEPYDHGEVHKHGQLRLIVDGEWMEVGEQEENWKQNGADRHFYFTEGDGNTWHLRSRGVTLEYALNAIPTLEATEDSVTYDGATYEDGDDASVTIRVNAERVDFESYELEHGDTIRVVVETTARQGGEGDDDGNETDDSGFRL